jgi:hypothetical protein
MKKCLLSLLLSLTVLLIPLDINAQSSISNKEEKISKIIMVKDGKSVELSLDEFEAHMRKDEQLNSQIDKEIQNKLLMKNNLITLKNKDNFTNNEINRSPGILYTHYRYDEWDNTPSSGIVDLQRRISVYKYNYTSAPTTHTITYSVTQAYSSNVSLTAKYEDAIEATIGSSYTETISKSTSDSYTIQPNHKGWVEYRPIMFTTWGCVYSKPYYIGNVWGEESFEKYVKVHFPIRQADGLPDGYYMFKEAPM